jgi:hypothetical protein
MSDYLKEVLANGRKLLTDTKTPKKYVEPEKKSGKLPNPAMGSGPLDKDPHKVFVKRAIKEKLKKHEIVEEVQKFCDSADADL